MSERISKLAFASRTSERVAKMTDLRLTDNEAAQQVLSTFARYKIKPRGFLRRTHFFHVRDGDFGRGMTAAIAQGWVALPPNRSKTYTYLLTEAGFNANLAAPETAE